MKPSPASRRVAHLTAAPWRGGSPAWPFLMGGAALGAASLIALLSLTGGAHAQSYSFTSQIGSNNTAATTQFSGFNYATIRQNGSGNTGSILQTGSGNAAAVIQVGSGFSKSIVQTGNNQSQSSFQFDTNGLTTRSGFRLVGSGLTSASIGFQIK